MYKRKLTVTGAGETYYVTLPKQLIQKLKWKKGEFKTIVKKGDELIIRDWSPDHE